MQMVAIVLLTVIIFFSTLIYFLERDEPDTTFVSIPAAFWWCLFSQTKWVPQTAGLPFISLNKMRVHLNIFISAGKLAGGAGITFGVLVLALPIAILVSIFCYKTIKIKNHCFLTNANAQVNNFMMVVKLREETLLKQFAERATVHGDHV
jgi:hypothetical protein